MDMKRYDNEKLKKRRYMEEEMKKEGMSKNTSMTTKVGKAT